MKKRLLNIFLSLTLTVIFIKLVSAQFGFYALEYFFDTLSPNTVVYTTLFFIIFPLIYFSLERGLMKKRSGIAVVIALASTILILYGLSRSGLDFRNYFYNLRVFGDILIAILWIAILIAVIWAFSKWGFGKGLMAIGALLIIISLTDIIYAKGTIISIGAVIIVIGFLMDFKKRQKEQRRRLTLEGLRY